MYKSSNVEKLGIETLAIHADDSLTELTDVAPSIHPTTTFNYDSDPNKLRPVSDFSNLTEAASSGGFIYSRESTRNVIRLEEVFDSILGSPYIDDNNNNDNLKKKAYSVVYGSGLSAVVGVYTYLNPKKVAITGGYHGVHGILDIFKRLKGENSFELLPLDCDIDKLGKGDVIHLESPINPTGISIDISYYAKKAHSKGAFLVIDSTFAPPPLQDPFQFGADIVIHSATKYFGGHSDLLAGVVAVKSEKIRQSLHADRLILGSIPGSLESWLLLRSLRTFKIRLLTQSQNATKLVSWLVEVKNTKKYNFIKQIYHSSLQNEPFVKQQLKGGYGPVFSFEFTKPEIAKVFPSKLHLFHHATSLGGVESLVEWRAMSDPKVSPSLIRVSVGAEDVDDLINDFKQAFDTFA